MTRFRLISLSSCHGQQRALPTGEAMSLFKLPGFHVSRLQVAGCRLQATTSCRPRPTLWTGRTPPWSYPIYPRGKTVSLSTNNKSGPLAEPWPGLHHLVLQARCSQTPSPLIRDDFDQSAAAPTRPHLLKPTGRSGIQKKPTLGPPDAHVPVPADSCTSMDDCFVCAGLQPSPAVLITAMAAVSPTSWMVDVTVEVVAAASSPLLTKRPDARCVGFMSTARLPHLFPTPRGFGSRNYTSTAAAAAVDASPR